MRAHRLLAKLGVWFVVLSSTFLGLPAEPAQAATLTDIVDTLSTTVAGATGATHTVTFTVQTTAQLKRITFRFSTTSGGTTKPASLNLASATLGTTNNIGGSWTLNTGSASSGILYIERVSSGTVNSGNAASIALQNITNSAIDDCETSNDILRDTCHLRVTTYSDDGVTAVDTGDGTYTVTEDPNLSFEVSDVASGQTNNGVTSNVSTTSTSIALGRIGSGTVRYGTHQLDITTNAPHGYVVYARLAGDLTGVTYVNNSFDPFGATNATWSTPQNWSSPTGTTPNTNTGWFGANTSDTDVSGWSSGSGKFGPLGTTARAVAQSSGPERSGSTIFVSYAIEVNVGQASDQYSASLIYDIRPIY